MQKSNSIAILLTLFIVFTTVCGCGSEIEIQNLNATGNNSYTLQFDGVNHDFIIDLPEDSSGAPLVVMLHGLGGDASEFRERMDFSQEATARGYAVLYITGAKSNLDATGATGWNSGIGNNDNKDVWFIRALVSYVEKEYGFDSNRTYAVGFSNGGFMAHRLAIEASDIFEGVVSIAGKMPANIWDKKKKKIDVNFLQITGEKDDVVPKKSDGSDKYSKDPAIEDVIEYYKDANRLNGEMTKELGFSSTLTMYGNSDNKVWNLFIEGGSHTVPEEKYTGFSLNEVLFEFFE